MIKQVEQLEAFYKLKLTENRHIKEYDLSSEMYSLEDELRHVNLKIEHVHQLKKENEANVKASIQKVRQSELQLKQATQAYDLAKVKFDSGVITNLELLEGATIVSESRLMLLKARIDYTVNLYKLKSAIGDRLY